MKTLLSSEVPLEKIMLPPGFSISIYAKVPNARSMTLSPSGTLFVGTRQRNPEDAKVYMVKDQDKDGVAETITVLKKGLNVPNGVAFKNGNLYVAEIDKILVFEDVERPRKKDEEYIQKVLPFKFSNIFHHGWKFIRFAPNGELVVPVGAPCNICNRKDFASIYSLNLKTFKKKLIAQGVRNTVGFDFHPLTNNLWFTDNGRDMMGNDIPPDELNHLEKEGDHFGYPFCHGKSITDPKYNENGEIKCRNFIPPKVEFPAHVASLGMRFYTGKLFPKRYHNQIFVAFHGSWNRTIPQGYRVQIVKLKGNKVISSKPFALGWLGKKGKKWGRPVDIEILKTGELLISDDYAGVIYKVSYSQPILKSK